jgi:hypothetical protein
MFVVRNAGASTASLGRRSSIVASAVRGADCTGGMDGSNSVSAGAISDIVGVMIAEVIGARVGASTTVTGNGSRVGVFIVVRASDGDASVSSDSSAGRT